MTTRNTYSGALIALHWLLGIAVIGMFALGLWMDSLGYYDPWYRKAPELHKGIGVILVTLMLLRLAVRWRQGVPAPLDSHSGLERRAAGTVQGILYLLVLLMFPSGYLISTADGRALDIFGLLSIPATITDIDNLEDIAGEVHEILAWCLIGLASLHALAALKHHFVDRDVTLKRMLGINPQRHG